MQGDEICLRVWDLAPSGKGIGHALSRSLDSILCVKKGLHRHPSAPVSDGLVPVQETWVWVTVESSLGASDAGKAVCSLMTLVCLQPSGSSAVLADTELLRQKPGA